MSMFSRHQQDHNCSQYTPPQQSMVATKAVVRESAANFVIIKGSEPLTMWFGCYLLWTISRGHFKRGYASSLALTSMVMSCS